MTPITLRTLADATAQEVFTQVARHLLTQLALSYGSGFSGCAYRGELGLRCAAGALIADDEYEPSMERHNWANLRAAGAVPAAHFRLICRLQDVHDNCDPCDWRGSLLAVAYKHGLQMPEVRG